MNTPLIGRVEVDEQSGMRLRITLHLSDTYSHLMLDPISIRQSWRPGGPVFQALMDRGWIDADGNIPRPFKGNGGARNNPEDSHIEVVFEYWFETTLH